jgi:hypothetical protein
MSEYKPLTQEEMEDFKNNINHPGLYIYRLFATIEHLQSEIKIKDEALQFVISEESANQEADEREVMDSALKNPGTTLYYVTRALYPKAREATHHDST